jgi:hypothetical protein
MKRHICTIVFSVLIGHPLSRSVTDKFISSENTMALIEEGFGWGVKSKIKVMNQWVNIVNYSVSPPPICAFLSPSSVVKDYVRSVG